MAKKYLLYIHSPQFDEETEKSKLVNALLFNHYDGKSQPFVTHRKEMAKVEPAEEVPALKKYDNPYACKKCGSILNAGKCLNKH